MSGKNPPDSWPETGNDEDDSNDVAEEHDELRLIPRPIIREINEN